MIWVHFIHENIRYNFSVRLTKLRTDKDISLSVRMTDIPATVFNTSDLYIGTLASQQLPIFAAAGAAHDRY